MLKNDFEKIQGDINAKMCNKHNKFNRFITRHLYVYPGEEIFQNMHTLNNAESSDMHLLGK